MQMIYNRLELMFSDSIAARMNFQRSKKSICLFCVYFRNIRLRGLRALKVILIVLLCCNCSVSCKKKEVLSFAPAGREPVIEPDYSGATIPYNIAPMNFIIKEPGKSFRITVKSENGSETEIKSAGGITKFPLKTWKKLVSENKGGKIEITVYARDGDNKVSEFAPICFYIAGESADPYLCYRLLYPGYESWSDMQIIQRSVSDFSEKIVIENQLLNDNCVNCHTFLNNDPGKFLVHVRGSLKGTYFVNYGRVDRRELRTGKMIANAVYPSWHPSGRYIAFSSNEIVQSFHMLPGKTTEVYDQSARLVLYDCRKDEITAVPDDDTVKYLETFPCWSPAGDFLYYCRTRQLTGSFDYRNIRYDLMRRPFDNSSGLFGKAEVIYDAQSKGKSVSFPSVSPDGNYLVFTLHDYGTFSIWHKEADLYLLDLLSGKVDSMSLNSSETESWHSWSSNGKWIVFSSKRGDGLTARPYLAYFGSPGNIGKPFVLPQEDPALYSRLDKTFNRPEFITGRITAGPRDFARASEKESVKARWNDTGK